MDNRTETHMGATVAWIALIVGVIALIIAWMAFNRASEMTLTEEVQQGTGQVVEDVRISAAETRAEARLTALRDNEDVRASSTAYLAEVEDIRTDLQEVYLGADTDVRAGWSSLGRQFTTLEEQIRNEDSNSTQTIQSLIAALQDDNRTN